MELGLAAGLTGWVVFQMVPLPPGVVAVLSLTRLAVFCSGEAGFGWGGAEAPCGLSPPPEWG